MSKAAKVSLQPFDPQHYLAFVRLWNYAYPHLKTTSTNFRLQDIYAPAGFQQKRWLAVENGVIVGFGGYENLRDEDFNPRQFRLHIVVNPASEGQGIGQALISQVLTELKQINALDAGVLVCLEREQSVGFALRNGFQGEIEWYLSRINLETFAIPHYDKLAAQWQRDGITFVPFSELAGETGAGRKLYELFSAVRNDTPSSSDAMTLPPLEEFVENIRRQPRQYEGYFIALHEGRFVGLGVLSRKPHNDEELHNDILGVLPEYRRQGVSLGVIARAIEWARSCGYIYATAENAASNKAVIPLMEMVGFQRQASWQLFRKVFE